MLFHPPRCPARDCSQHRNPTRSFFQRRGFYRPQCRRQPIQRFRCKTCRRSFSSQTFRADYRDRKPFANSALIKLSSSGVGIRQAARLLGMHPNGVLYKQRKLARILAMLHENLSARLPTILERPQHADHLASTFTPTFQLDEEESYEALSIRPLTVPIVIERETWFIVATEVGPIRRLAPAGSSRRKRQERDEQLHGRRKDESRMRVRNTLLELSRRLPDGNLTLQTDRKASYKTLIRQIFAGRAAHETESGRAPRTPSNLLFPINKTIAMSRDNCSRLRRQSWLVAKTADGLRRGLMIFTVFRNYVRKRFNRDEPSQSPAAILGLTPRALSFEELVRWRQDWGIRSPCPLRRDGRTSSPRGPSKAACTRKSPAE